MRKILSNGSGAPLMEDFDNLERWKETERNSGIKQPEFVDPATNVIKEYQHQR
jgi:hypothetical protein